MLFIAQIAALTGHGLNIGQPDVLPAHVLQRVPPQFVLTHHRPAFEHVFLSPGTACLARISLDMVGAGLPGSQMTQRCFLRWSQLRIPRGLEFR